MASLIDRAIPVPLSSSNTMSLNSMYLLLSMLSGMEETIAACDVVGRVCKSVGTEQQRSASILQVCARMRFAFACGPCDRQSAATLLTFVLPYLQHWWQTKPALPGSNARSATDLHNAHKLTYMGSLKLLFMCSNANQNCERNAASSSFPIFVAGLTAVDEQVKEATCILFSALAQHASLHQPLLQAGVLMPLLAILHSRSSRTQELATAILLQLGQGQLGR